jgi:hypothetical protein
MPILRSDDRVSAARRARGYTDKKLTHFWDEQRLTGNLWQRVLRRKALPWDVYFLYSAEAQWETEPTAPDFWVRQLNIVKRKRFAVKIKEMLGQGQ